ncbi:MAG: pentapeptide repeat-containing protein [Oculatellaceae cyanobacterium Prado106]|jgi:uncharacterized protein YjbI with pentapeptide repeats|nr:pentapeptide repeat-containing protein [Oculatellaceae cyanobacterium Prado106]
MTQDFCQAKLQGRSFQGQDLTGADFSKADIRGANFTNAVLVGANFTDARAGLKPLAAIALILDTLLLATLAGLIGGFAASWIALTAEDPAIHNVLLEALLTSLFPTATFAGFCWIIVRRGIGETLGIVSVVMVVIAMVVAILIPTGSSADFKLAVMIARSIAIAGTGAALGLGAIAIAIARTHRAIMRVPLGGCAIGGAIAGAMVGAVNATVDSWEWILVTLMVMALAWLSVWVGQHAMQKDKRYLLIRRLAMSILCLGGTSFKGANLTDANFTQALLKSTNFRESTLLRTCWFQAQKLDQAQVEQTYLAHPQLQALVVFKQGKEQNYDRLSLRGLNLQEANLTDASFLGADLSEANLQNADLSRAKLVEAQFYRANLNSARLTGACIQDWAISTDTQLENIQCDYIYMRLPTKTDPDPWRKPDNRSEIFQPGDFADFIAPIVKTLDLYRQQNLDPRQIITPKSTLDLYHYQGIDPSAAAIALKQLSEQYPEAGLEVVTLEGRGDEKIRLQARVTGTADRSILSEEYFEKYEELTALPHSNLQSLLTAISEKDERIRSLENMVMTAVKSDKFYVETYYNLTESESKPAQKILILTANPHSTSPLRLNEEVREIETGLERSKMRDQFEVVSKWAVRTADLRRALLDHEPQIVHFSGHGAGTEGLILEDESGQTKLVSTEALVELFTLFKDKVQCVLLNACYSDTQAIAICQHIPYVIGMNRAIGDRAAIEFAVGFYDALGAGRSIEDAYRMGRVSINLEGIPESLTPVLKQKI